MYSGEAHQILNEDDFALLELSNSRGPALRAGNNPFRESYNEWLCFSSEHYDLRFSEHELEELVLVPTIAIWNDGHLFEFEISISTIGEFGMAIFRQWEALLEGETSLCVMAAFLQNLGTEDRSLWILQALKTPKGYWHESVLE
jgi:hypothetical protein